MGLGTDSALDTIVHAGLHAALPKFYPTVVAIQARTAVQAANGELTYTWQTFTSAMGNFADPDRMAQEQRGADMTRITTQPALNLDGYYPTITVAHRVMVNATAYNIAGISHDSVGGSTRLQLERVTT